MTAINLIPQADAAYLMSDQAALCHDGILHVIGSKVLIAPHISVAMGSSGLFLHDETLFADWLAECTDQQAFLSGLPRILKQWMDELETGIAGQEIEIAGDIAFFRQLYIAMWSKQRDRAEAMVIGSAKGTFGPGYKPYSVKSVSRVIQPSLGPSFEITGRVTPSLARAIFERQRRSPDDRGIYRVGGAGDLVAVTRDGISRSVVVRWHDKIGAPIRL